MKKLLTLILALSLPFIVNAETGRSTDIRYHGDWSSARVCFADQCIWRASTVSGDTILSVDFADNLTYGYVLYTQNIPLSVMNQWDTDTDFITLDFRVDKRQKYRVSAERTLIRNEHTLYYDLPNKELGNQFADDLRKGNTLRIRFHINDETIIESFSLKGANAAISRADYKSEKIYIDKEKENAYFE